MRKGKLRSIFAFLGDGNILSLGLLLNLNQYVVSADIKNANTFFANN